MEWFKNRPERPKNPARLDEWRRLTEEWEKTQPISCDEATFSMRLFDGPWIAPGETCYEALLAYEELAIAGADEETLRREASLIYDDVRASVALNIRLEEGAQRMREAAKRLRGR